MPKVVSTDDVRAQGNGAVFMDNLTLSHALRPLIGYRARDVTRDDIIGRYVGRETLLYDDAFRIFQLRGNKRNYPLNDAFRFAVDLFSLGQLIQSIIIFDKIAVDSAWADRWDVIVRQGDEVVFPRVGASLGSIVVPVEADPAHALALLASAVWKTSVYAQTDAFPEFMRLLCVTGTESAFMGMSDAYFQTGYSDPALFPLTDSLPDYEEPSDHPGGTLDKQKRSSKIDALGSLMDRISECWDDLRQRSVLERTDFEPGIAGRDMSSRHVLQNAVAAFFHHELAHACGLPYFPHLLRSSFLILDRVAGELGVSSTAQEIVEAMERSRAGRVQPINEFYQNEVIDVRIPTFLSAVLREAQSPSQILPVAMEMRATKEARGFRRWAAEADRQVAEGAIDQEKLRREVSEIQDYVDGWIGRTPASGREVELSIAIGPVGIEWPMSWPRFPFTRKPHLLFLQRMAQVSDLTSHFAALVEKVFGTQIGEIYNKYRSTMARFQRPLPDAPGGRQSPLAWDLTELYRSVVEAMVELERRGDLGDDEQVIWDEVKAIVAERLGL